MCERAPLDRERPVIATHNRLGQRGLDGQHGQRRPDDPAQSLADGDLARMLLAVELAMTTTRGSWDEVTDALLAAKKRPLDRSARADLFYGAPALTFVLDTTGAQYRARWAHELAALDQILVELTAERFEAVNDRIEAGAPTHGSEFDLMTGLTGLGMVLLRRAVHQPARGTALDEAVSGALSGVLSYLVDRSKDRILSEVLLPGWWSASAPQPTTPVGDKQPNGYADFGMARGGAGILAFLAASYRAGYAVPGQAEAIRHITGWYTRWRQETPDKVTWWPQQLSLDELRTGRVHQPGPSEPTWAHGTPGIGRALQMAGIALGDERGRVVAEDAVASCLTQRELNRLTEPDLYVGTGGMYLTVLRAAEDAEAFMALHRRGHSLETSRLGVAADAVSRTSRVLPDPDDTEFLWGRFGTRLVFESLRTRAAPVSGADGVLGIGWAE
ncbi:lanthionine synthetase C family protein [Promicromonospora umidemergens]|uniref:Lanthionine synthetase-like protein n=1 Tax=Promicromonospora umidemergens TaxID=629679 RepID=A0ABP8Y247_9MICO|nr:lanthionine synthetase C family protein [Promicromonospora umidemergens]